MTWIQTYTGKRFDLLNPDPESVCIEDIAKALSRIPRFNGHTKTFYSVAEHSVHAARLVSRENKLWGLLHDASEAYVGDMVRPLKLQIPLFRAFEDRIMEAICARFSLNPVMPDEVRVVDNRLLVTEARDLMGPPPDAWETRAQPIEGLCMQNTSQPEAAEALFLAMFKSIQLTRVAGGY